MRYEIQYFENGAMVASIEHPGPLNATCEAAGTGLLEHHARKARVMDSDGSGAEVCSVLSGYIGIKGPPDLRDRAQLVPARMALAICGR